MSSTLFYSFLSLLIWTPFAFGAVHALAYSLLALHAFLLVTLWMIIEGGRMWRHREVSAFVWTPIAVPIVLFLAFLAIQLLPLPPFLLRLLSPTTGELHRLFLPDASTVWMPLSLNPYATQVALVKLLAYTSIFFLVVNIARTRQQIRTIAWVIVVVAASMAVFGIAQRVLGIQTIYGLRDVSAIGNSFGPYINGNHFAGYEAMAICLGLGLLLSQGLESHGTEKRSWRQAFRRLPRMSFLQRPLLIICLIAMVSALVLSRSRGGFIALLAGMIGFVILLRFRRQDAQRRHGLVTILITMGGITLLLGVPLLIRFLQIFTGQELLEGGGGRLAVFEATWHMANDFPLFGIGYEAYASIFPRYQQAAELLQTYSHAHNDILQLLAETGRVGFLIVAVGAGLGSVRIWRRWRQRRDAFVQVMVPAGLAACLAIATHSLVDFNLHIPANALLATTILALTFACVQRSRQGEDIRPPQRGLWGRVGMRGAPWVAIGVMIWGGTVAVRVGVADVFYPQLKSPYKTHWTNQGDAEMRVTRLRQALAWTPDNPVYLVALGELRTYQAWRALVAKDISDDVKAQEIATLQQAAELYEQSLRQTPTEVHAQLGWLRNRMIHQLFGILPPSEDEDDLLSRCEQVATLAPTYPHIQYGLGDILLYSQDKMAELHVALPFFRRAVQLHQRYDEPVWNAYRRILPEAKALQNFARTMPNTAQGHLKIAQIIEDTHWPQARLHYRAAMSLSRSDPTILSAYADALMHHEDFVLARQLWSRYLDLVPEQADAYLKLASASKALKDDAGTVQALEQLVARFPDQARYESELAQAYLRMGKTEAAAEAWQRVVALKPRSPLAYVNLARI
ncbi:MAG: hypothetical protein ETSY1_25970 [Candidatus Entotheonella factor]|uniref:O-antigen ligase-related domain-containing protein n=1 Tax=Entotheonella factor TaxID=1429438 RepID=W4LGY5_ENTF1|nr:MAG: hypothetical protein ETSY1_25970 [Candidatus Entotheonella factor]